MAASFNFSLPETAAFWDARSATADFRHPLERERLEHFAPEVGPLRILDVGCGYGRTLAELHSSGHRHLTGIDLSAGMLARARSQLPEDVELHQVRSTTLPFEDDSFEVLLYLATFTSVPDAATQRTMVAEAQRVLVPGGLVFVSDLLLQNDARNHQRYVEGHRRFGEHGVFETQDGGVFRHHAEDWFDTLFGAFERLGREPFTGRTMNGHEAQLVRMWFRRSP